jgi:hypothetical protein
VGCSDKGQPQDKYTVSEKSGRNIVDRRPLIGYAVVSGAGKLRARPGISVTTLQLPYTLLHATRKHGGCDMPTF